ncbi:MAG: MAPEG family protein [Cellvibrionaceae bacterium]
MEITPIYIALCALLYILLSYLVVRQRRNLRVAIGDGGEEALLCAIRVQANASEYLPIALLLLVGLELSTSSWNMAWLVHVFGSVIFISRVLHAFGLSNTPGVSKGRFFGTLFTWLSIIAMAVLILVAKLV